ncbi:MAG: response regulator transcription factor [Anaerolineales bacterium]|nr:response regulator transcription factor [Anaerolineales bacterium]
MTESTIPNAAAGHKLRVLIADDSRAVRQSLARWLESVGTLEIIGQTSDGASTLDAIRAERPDVVILDLRMPKGNGLDVLEALRHAAHRPQVIVLTNFAFPQYRQLCLDAGATYFIDKSKEFDQLPQVLEQLSRASG